MDNAFIESLNGKFRGECLNTHWFTNLDEMRRICEDWRRDYNEVRPHSAIGNKPPISLMSCSELHGPSLSMEERWKTSSVVQRWGSSNEELALLPIG